MELSETGTGVIEKEELLELVPHRGKMLLISRVLEYNLRDRTLRSEYDLTEDCIFYDPALDGVPGWACFEFMAQAISAMAGLTAKAMGLPCLLGFLLSVSALEIRQKLYRAGSVLQVSIAQEFNIDRVYNVKCELFVKNELAARAKITVLNVDDFSSFIEKDNYEK